MSADTSILNRIESKVDDVVTDLRGPPGESGKGLIYRTLAMESYIASQKWFVRVLVAAICTSTVTTAINLVLIYKGSHP